MKRKLSYLAAAAAALFLATAAAVPARLNETGAAPRAEASPEHIVALRHDPRFILEAVARRMGVTLRPEIPPPAIRLESRTPLQRLQVAAERQWGFRPHVFTTTYASASNEIYLIDGAADYLPYDRTPDDSLAHELVHYLQANYLKDDFSTDGSESEAVAIQTWFRNEHMAPRLAANARP
jgi:hypothetical protein